MLIIWYNYSGIKPLSIVTHIPTPIITIIKRINNKKRKGALL
jgi:hypothetical protein